VVTVTDFRRGGSRGKKGEKRSSAQPALCGDLEGCVGPGEWEGGSRGSGYVYTYS